MKKVTANYYLDILAFIEFSFLTTSGILIQYSLPVRSGPMTIWGLTRHQWGDIHFYIAIALFATMALHIIFHWKWIFSLTRGAHKEGSGRRLLIGVFALVVVVLLAAAPLVSPTQGTPATHGYHGNPVH